MLRLPEYAELGAQFQANVESPTLKKFTRRKYDGRVLNFVDIEAEVVSHSILVDPE